jgi:hypothetical protein
VERLSARAENDGGCSTSKTGVVAGAVATGVDGVALGEEGDAVGGASCL